MLPITLDPKAVQIGLVGAGEALARRRVMLADAGVVPVALAADASLASLRALFVAGLDQVEAAALAARARALGVLVNVEDVPELCDFHVPASVRRGDLLLTVSTSGQAPGLARRLREWLEQAFGPEWQERLQEVAAARTGWRAQGLAAAEVSQRTRALIAQEGWLE